MTFSDIKARHQRSSPSYMQGVSLLLRLDRPIGIWLLLAPAWSGCALAGATFTHWQDYLLLAIGAFLTRSAGCVINDILDEKFDAQNERTRHRPLPAKHITPSHAFLWLFILLFAALSLVLFFVPHILPLSILLCVLLLLYPFAKRVTSYPQVILGLVFNGGVFIGFALLRDDMPWSLVMLYGSFVMLTLIYDSFYALMDKKSDKELNLGSLALIIKDMRLLGWGGYGMATCLLLLSLASYSLFVFLCVLVVMIHGVRLSYHLHDAPSPHHALMAFRAHAASLFLIFTLTFSAGSHDIL